MKELTLSIIIPNYNSGPLLDLSLASIFSADISISFEVLIMDNLSNDNPAKQLINYPKENLFFYSEKDSGIYDAMNKGVKIAKGEWFYFLGAGDKLKIEKLNYSHFNLNADLLYFKFYFKSKNETVGCEINLFDLLRCNLCQQAVFYKSSIFNTVGNFSSKYPILADYEFNLKIFFIDSLKKIFFDEVIADYDGFGISSQKKDVLFNSGKNLIIINLLLKSFTVTNLYFVIRYYLRYAKNKIDFELKKFRVFQA